MMKAERYQVERRTFGDEWIVRIVETGESFDEYDSHKAAEHDAKILNEVVRLIEESKGVH